MKPKQLITGIFLVVLSCEQPDPIPLTFYEEMTQHFESYGFEVVDQGDYREVTIDGIERHNQILSDLQSLFKKKYNISIDFDHWKNTLVNSNGRVKHCRKTTYTFSYRRNGTLCSWVTKTECDSVDEVATKLLWCEKVDHPHVDADK